MELIDNITAEEYYISILRDYASKCRHEVLAEAVIWFETLHGHHSQGVLKDH